MVSIGVAARRGQLLICSSSSRAPCDRASARGSACSAADGRRSSNSEVWPPAASARCSVRPTGPAPMIRMSTFSTAASVTMHDLLDLGDGLRCRRVDVTTRFGDAHVVFAADADAGQHFGNVVGRADVEAGLDSDGHARLQGRPLLADLVFAGVVHVEPEPVAGAVHVETAEIALFDQVVEVAVEQLEVDQTLGQHADRSIVAFHEMAAGGGGGDGGGLGGEDDFVNVLLRRVEAAIDRAGAGDVGGVAFDLAAGVDQDQGVVVEQLVVLDVVQHAGVGATGDDGRVGVGVGAAFAEFVGQLGFQFVLGQAGTTGAHGAGVAGAGDVGRALLDVGFGGVLDQAHGVEFSAQVIDGARRPLAGPGLGADFVQGLGDPRVPFGVVADGVPQRVAVDEEFGQFFVELLDGVGSVETEGTFGGFRSVTVAVPDFALFVLFAAEQNGV